MASVPETKTVIVKHSTDFLLVAEDFKIDLSRCVAEASMLSAFDHHLPFKTPRLHLFDRETNTQVHQDFPNAANLEPLIASPTFSPTIAARIGHGIGSALRSFHTWASNSAQSGMRAEIWENEPMRRLKHQTSYGSLIGVLENFPTLLQDCRKEFEDMRDMAAGEFDRDATDGGDPHWGLIHGDFCAGNVLLENGVPSEIGNSLIIIDWELAQFGHRAYDLGQMIGDLCEKAFLDKGSGAVSAIEGFANGYGEISEALAFRAAIHAGAHFIHWYIRRRPSAASFTDREIVDAMKLGRDYVLKGWEKDRDWFLGTALAPLFGARNSELDSSRGYRSSTHSPSQPG